MPSSRTLGNCFYMFFMEAPPLRPPDYHYTEVFVVAKMHTRCLKTDLSQKYGDSSCNLEVPGCHADPLKQAYR